MLDRLWAKRILNGDKMAGERLVAENYPRIYRLLRNLTGSVETANDLTQQAFVRAWQALPNYRGEARLATWLHRIAYHEYTHWLRDRRQTVPLEAAAELIDLRAVAGLNTVLVREALARLPDEHRETFILHYIQELSVAEVALVLEVPPGTVKSRLHAARRMLRELLQETQALPASSSGSMFSIQPTLSATASSATPASATALIPQKEEISHGLPVSRL